MRLLLKYIGSQEWTGYGWMNRKVKLSRKQISSQTNKNHFLSIMMTDGCLEIYVYKCGCLLVYLKLPFRKYNEFGLSVRHFDNGLEKDIGVTFIRFGDNTKLEEIVNVMGDTHDKMMS